MATASNSSDAIQSRITQMEAAFGVLDRNLDGKLDLHEFLQGVRHDESLGLIREAFRLQCQASEGSLFSEPRDRQTSIQSWPSDVAAPGTSSSRPCASVRGCHSAVSAVKGCVTM